MAIPTKSICIVGRVSKPVIRLDPQVITNLLSVVEEAALHEAFFDDFFTSHHLLAPFHSNGFCAIVTASENNLKGYCLEETEIFGKKEHNYYDFSFDEVVLARKWIDSTAACEAKIYNSVVLLHQETMRFYLQWRNLLSRSWWVLRIFSDLPWKINYSWTGDRREVWSMPSMKRMRGESAENVKFHLWRCYEEIHS